MKKNMNSLYIIELDEDVMFAVECATFEGCYSQGKTINESLENI